MDEQYKTEDFGKMLGESIKTLNTGDTVVGVVMDISPTEIKLDLGAKSTGVVTRDQITDDPNAKLADMFKIGDEVEAFVIKVSDVDGIAMLSKKRVDASKNWKNIVAAAESKETVEGRVTEAVKGGVVMSVDGVRVFVPASQTGIPKEGDLNTLVGTTQKIKIIEVREDRKRAYGSIREYRQAERKAKEEAFWSNIHEGDTYEGPVKSLTSFGAFVDLGGVDGMVHMSELSWKHIRHPSEVVKVGDVIKVFVKSFDREKKRISLGYKTEDTDPWKIFTDKYKVGDIATVKIVSLMPFGAFAEVVPGADGLIHISQIAREKVARTADVLEVGQEVDVKITDIDYEHKKISLSIRALLDDLDALEEEAAADAAAESESN
jgi:ribosomal protein S1